MPDSYSVGVALLRSTAPSLDGLSEMKTAGANVLIKLLAEKAGSRGEIVVRPAGFVEGACRRPR